MQKKKGVDNAFLKNIKKCHCLRSLLYVGIKGKIEQWFLYTFWGKIDA